MLRLVKVCMPTSDYDDGDVEETVEEILQAKKPYYNVVMGDFNAKIGTKKRT